MYGAGMQTADEQTLQLQSLVDKTGSGADLSIDRDWQISNTIYLSRDVCITGTKNRDIKFSSITDTQKTRDNWTIQLVGTRNVPLFLVGSAEKLRNLCDNSDAEQIYPRGSYDCNVRIAHLHLVGNNTCSVKHGSADSCDTVISRGEWKDDQELKDRLAGLGRSPGLAFPSSNTCLAASYGPSCSGTCTCSISEQRLTEVDRNHDVWSYLCKDKACTQLTDCKIDQSYKLDLYKASAIQVVHASCLVDNCYVEKGVSAGIGAVAHSNVGITNCCLCNNRWDGFGPDQLRAGYMYSTYTFGNQAGVSMSKGWPSTPNEPMCFKYCQLDDGLFINHYTDVTFEACTIAGDVELGNLPMKDNDVGTAVAFKNCNMHKPVAKGWKCSLNLWGPSDCTFVFDASPPRDSCA